QASTTLTESLPLSDTVTITQSVSRSLTESLPLSDTVTTSKQASTTLTESLPLSDTVTTSKQASTTLTESLPLSDTVTTSKQASTTLTESLPLSDTVTTSKQATVNLSESLPLSDTVTTSKQASATLTESLPLSDTVTTSKQASTTLTESLPLSDTVTITQSVSRSLTESLPLSDTFVVVQKRATTSLSESLPLSDTVTTSKQASTSLSESLPLSDTVTITKKTSLNLSESLPLSDTVTITKKTSLNLSESLPLSDTVTTSKKSTVNLSESLPLSDTVTTSKQASTSLSESLPLSDTVSITQSLSRSLSESLPLSDTVTITKKSSTTLSESLPLSDTVTTTQSVSRSLSDSLPLSDTFVVVQKRATTSLSESLPLSDTVTITKKSSPSLAESLPLSDTVSVIKKSSSTLSESLPLADTFVVVQKRATTTISESLPLSDTITASKKTSTSITESLPLADTITTFKKSSTTLTESLPLSDTFTVVHQSLFRSVSDSLPIDAIFPDISLGGIVIEARDENDVLQPGATYTVRANPYGGSTPMTVVDGGLNDHTGAPADGQIVVTKAPFGTYNVTMTTIPPGFNVLGNSTLYSVHGTNFNGTTQLQITVFRLVHTSYNLVTLPKTVITTAPHLNGTVLDTWINSFKAIEVNKTSQTVTRVTNLPPILSAGTNSTTGINGAIGNQSSVFLQTSSYASQTNGSKIIQGIGIPTYSMPRDSSVISVVPSVVIAPSTSTPDQTIATPQLDKIVPGQRIVLPVQQSLIPSTGGLKQLNVTSKSGLPLGTNATTDWFVIKTSNSLPSSKSVLPQKDKLILYANVTYQFEATRTGFNWGDPTKVSSATLTLQVPKNPSGISTDKNGCPVSDIYYYNTVSNSWSTNSVTIISGPTPTAGNTNTCDVVIQTPHFTQFALGSPAAAASTPSGPASIGFGAGGGATGTGPGAAATSTSAAGAGAGPLLKIQKISYDLCDTQTVRIQVATDTNQTDPSVIVRTSISGVVSAKLVPDQPFAEENINATVRKLVYEAHISSSEKSFEVVAMEAIGHNIYSVGKTVEVSGCHEDLDYTKLELILHPVEVDLAAPKIFDFKFQVGNETKQLASEPTIQYIDNKPLSVYAIVDSSTPLATSDLRFTDVTNQDSSKYHTTAMTVTPLQISNSTYLLSATIPSDLLDAPGMKYWIHIENNAHKTADSDIATIGVKTDYPVDAKLELDVSQNRAAGTTARPAAYLTNNGQTVYGTISLVVDGTTVYTSPGELFSKGQTPVRLEWKTQPTDDLVNHKIEAIAHIYDKSFTAQANIITFTSIKTESIAQPVTISPINDNNGIAIANPQILYSSFDNSDTMRYKVIAPDGTCVIGAADECLVKESTFGQPGQIKSVVVGDQVFRVRYSGTSDPLERFSITSVDPIVGTWKVEIDSQIDLSPQTQVMESVPLKIIFRPVEIPFLSE
ncbi:MAG: hypothetical protein KGI28_08410, partial [Thaumarchaeota archaeon]|nr:hypothetical protein [Nitrososphaerota archaeon]